ncbi:hypothetical protein K2173_012051 [Erythroxylum novogranatense]|uniref:Uncharacterized protein n=1 Tax=Erythroxylum novogranatense TaxID=1862640 RepID=A0AAV8TGH3_9ROSI|nr:hypothetical protein K2173_012051 [Erythroxylum novogranatense]
MALNNLVLSSYLVAPRNHLWSIKSIKYFPMRVQSNLGHQIRDQEVPRRSANYQPSVWNYDYIQSLNSEFLAESYTERIKKLKEDVKKLLSKTVTRLDQLELIDCLQRLGVDYHFEDEIDMILKRIYNDKLKDKSSYHRALEFRLLRQHGYRVAVDVFNNIRDDLENFSACSDSTMGLLSLYEASFLLEEGESVLEDGRDFAEEHLKEFFNSNEGDDRYISMLVSHALELPLHWRVPRVEARWFIDAYRTKQSMSLLLLEFAILDFNFVQAVHQEDLKDVSKWWRNTGLAEKLPFARDRIVQSFLLAMGVTFEPQFAYCRRVCTKVNQLVTTIDDIYDVHGTLEELEVFTQVVERWDVKEIDRLPDYMKLCFLALFNFVNGLGYAAMKEHGVDIIPYLKRTWMDLCKACLLESRWSFNGHTPTLEEYLDNAWISTSGPVVLLHTYFTSVTSITERELESVRQWSDIIRLSSMVFRLANDLGTSSKEFKKGDIPKSIQCHMYETEASEPESRAHVRNLIGEIWKKMNSGAVNPSSSRKFVRIITNMARTAQFMYQHGDGFGFVDPEIKNRILAILVHPISNFEFQKEFHREALLFLFKFKLIIKI